MKTSKCRTCGRSVDAPYRSYNVDVVAQGCIDADHDGHLISAVDQAWHGRPEAVAHRHREAAHLSFMLLAR